VVAISRDDELGWLGLEHLSRLPAPCIRHASAEGLLIDRRNLHAPLNDLRPAATVSVVGARAGQDPKILSKILDAEASTGNFAKRWYATADAVVFHTPPEASASLERALHHLLVSPEAIP
jgi:hypothetical protein